MNVSSNLVNVQISKYILPQYVLLQCYPSDFPHDPRLPQQWWLSQSRFSLHFSNRSNQSSIVNMSVTMDGSKMDVVDEEMMMAQRVQAEREKDRDNERRIADLKLESEVRMAHSQFSCINNTMATEHCISHTHAIH